MIFSLFQGSVYALVLAINTAVDFITVSMTFKLFWRRVVPVSITSRIASALSGGLASVAPNERKILTLELFPLLHHGVITKGSSSLKFFM